MKLTDRSCLMGAAVLAALTLSSAAQADHHARRAHAAAVQNNKNTMRNLTLGGAAIAGYGLLTHNTTATVVGAAGAALAGSQYENARKDQSQQSAARHRYHRYSR